VVILTEARPLDVDSGQDGGRLNFDVRWFGSPAWPDNPHRLRRPGLVASAPGRWLGLVRGWLPLSGLWRKCPTTNGGLFRRAEQAEATVGSLTAVSLMEREMVEFFRNRARAFRLGGLGC
jgi:hypothetical protein